MTDGHISVNDRCCAIAHFRGEVGSTGVEPYNQASLYYLESTREHATKMGGSSLPCMIILLFGLFGLFLLKASLNHHIFNQDRILPLQERRGICVQ